MYVDEEWSDRRARLAPSGGAGPREQGYGRFMQPDPIGYGDGLNWYNYVGGDPVNATDPSGLYVDSCSGLNVKGPVGDIEVCGNRGGHPSGGQPSDIPQPPFALPASYEGPSYYGDNGAAGGYFKPDTKFDKCLNKVAGEYGIGLALDILGFIPGESQLMGLFRLQVAGGALINSALHGDYNGMGAAGASYGVETAGFGTSARSTASRAVPVVGYAVNAYATGRDAKNAAAAFSKCMAGK